MRTGLLVAVVALTATLSPIRLTPSVGATPELGACLLDGADTPRGGRFRAHDKLVMTYLYYWYDADSLADPTLALRPPADPAADWRDPSWHRRQLADMAEVGVDVALAVYWGDGPSWSTGGLETLVAARESLLAEGTSPPAIGLFLDTNLFASRLGRRSDVLDLTDEDGLASLAEQVVGFYDRVPACHRAYVDGRPLMFLWRPDTEDGHILRFAEDTFDALYARFEGQLGVRPYVVREQTWDVRAQRAGIAVESDGVFEWGAALNGPRFRGRTVAVGPGYDDLLLDGRPGYHRAREDGRTYARDLRAAVLSGASWLLLETWNELWEATAIAETAEHGRAYLHITRRYATLFHRLGPERPRDGWVDLGSGQGDYLGWLTDSWQDLGTWTIAGRRASARPIVEPGAEAGYFHFAVPARLRRTDLGPVEVLVEYFDEGEGSFLLEYDSADVDAPAEGSLKRTPPVPIENTGEWRRHTFFLPDARFGRRQYRGFGDFRIRDQPADLGSGHAFGRVTLRTAPEPRAILLGPEALTALDGSGPVELRWREIDGAAGYVVELGPLGALAPTMHGHNGADRARCTAGGAWPWEWPAVAVVAESSCRVNVGESAPPGVYRWRVRALDPLGNPIGEPSDWGYLTIGE